MFSKQEKVERQVKEKSNLKVTLNDRIQQIEQKIFEHGERISGLEEAGKRNATFQETDGIVTMDPEQVYFKHC